MEKGRPGRESRLQALKRGVHVVVGTHLMMPDLRSLRIADDESRVVRLVGKPREADLGRIAGRRQHDQPDDHLGVAIGERLERERRDPVGVADQQPALTQAVEPQ